VPNELSVHRPLRRSATQPLSPSCLVITWPLSAFWGGANFLKLRKQRWYTMVSVNGFGFNKLLVLHKVFKHRNVFFDTILFCQENDFCAFYYFLRTNN
jgi:hypothetical protein